jgi:hypothetical protein
VNEHHGLTIFHTIFMREHNRLADALRDMNPHWDGEKIYQEARQVMWAQEQAIIYNEFLPAVLGMDTMQKYNLELLTSGYYYGRHAMSLLKR